MVQPCLAVCLGLSKPSTSNGRPYFAGQWMFRPISPAEQAAEVILAEMEDPDRTLVEVGVGPQERVTLSLAQAARSTT